MSPASIPTAYGSKATRDGSSSPAARSTPTRNRFLKPSSAPTIFGSTRATIISGNFLDCIKTKKECIASPEIAHHSIAVGHLGLIAIKLGRKVQWDPQKEQFVNDPEADKLLQPRPLRAPWRL